MEKLTNEEIEKKYRRLCHNSPVGYLYNRIGWFDWQELPQTGMTVFMGKKPLRYGDVEEKHRPDTVVISYFPKEEDVTKNKVVIQMMGVTIKYRITPKDDPQALNPDEPELLRNLIAEIREAIKFQRHAA